MNLLSIERLNEKFSIKLFLLVALFVFIVFSSFTAMFVHLEGKSLNDSLIMDSKLLAGILAQNTRLGVFSENEAMLRDSVESVFQKEDILDISIYNKNGILLKTKGKNENVSPGKSSEKKRNKAGDIIKRLRESNETIYIEEKETLKFWAPVLSRYDRSMTGTVFDHESKALKGDRLIGFVQVTVAKEKLNRQIRSLLLRSVIIAAAFFIIGSFFIYSIMKRLTKPLDRLTEAVNTVGAGMAAEKVHVETKDEIGKLANAFNNMAESIKEREDALKESETKYRNLFEESRDIIFVIDKKGRFMDINHAAVDLFGYSKKELLETGIDKLFLDPGELREIQKYIENNNYVKDREIGLKKKDSTPLDCLLTLGVPKTESSGITGYQGIIRDVTHQKTLEMQLQQAKKMESIGTLAGGIAHDFNNILSPIMLHSEMLMVELSDGDPSQKGLREIYRAAERARDLVRQILTFARKRSEERVMLKMSLIIKESIRFLRSTIPTTIDIRFDNRTDEDTVFADSTQLNQIIMNLCTNAAYSMKESGGLLKLILENEDIAVEKMNKSCILKPGKYIKLSVKDNGGGIPSEVIDRIFEPYFTTKKTGEGTGLGLSTIHGIVKNYEGDITVESKTGDGTTFHVYLPLAAEKYSENNMDKSDIPIGSETILFIDDEELTVNSMKEMLAKLGYKVIARTDSLQALEIFRSNPDEFDLVITDMTMPNMTGKELAVEFKRILPGIPVILCTGFSDQMDSVRAGEIGIDAFIMKPIIRSRIASVIREVLDKA